jgi:hypothetical protein
MKHPATNGAFECAMKCIGASSTLYENVDRSEILAEVEQLS